MFQQYNFMFKYKSLIINCCWYNNNNNNNNNIKLRLFPSIKESCSHV